MLCVVLPVLRVSASFQGPKLPVLRVSASFQGPKLPRKEVEPQLCHLGVLDKMQTLTRKVGWGAPDSAFITSPQVTLVLFNSGPHLKRQGG